MSDRKWLLFVFIGFIFFIAAHLLIWTFFTRDLLTDNIKSGDYTRVGYISGSSYTAKPGYDGATLHIESSDFKQGPVDLITLGDSFSNGCGKKNHYYQDWIAANRSLKVLNIQPLPKSGFFETIVIMLHSGLLDELRPKFILIERVERHVYDSFSKNFDMNQTRPIAEVQRDFLQEHYTNIPPSVGFLNVGNLKFILYSFLRKFRDNAFFSKVYMRDLDRAFFNVRNQQSLIFGYEDVGHLRNESDDSIKKINDNLNALADKLSEKGIKLYFIPVVDKYNLFSRFLVQNPYPMSTFFEKFRLLKKRYHWVDTKAILSQELDKGKKDVFWADDSHWSWSSIGSVCKMLRLDVSS